MTATGPCVRCQQPCPLYPDGRCRLCATCETAVDQLLADLGLAAGEPEDAP